MPVSNINPQPPKTPCQYCGLWRYCQRIHKPRQRKNGTWFYPLLSLCQICVYGVEVIKAHVVLAWEEVA